MTAPVYSERIEPGWFPLDVMRTEWRKWDWVALMIDVDPDEFRRGHRTANECLVRIPGKHRNWEAAWAAFEAMTATRH